MSGEELHDILREIDTNMNGQVELDEYLQVRIISSALFLFLFLPQFNHINFISTPWMVFEIDSHYATHSCLFSVLPSLIST